jgi:hypothetical protein
MNEPRDRIASRITLQPSDSGRHFVSEVAWHGKLLLAAGYAFRFTDLQPLSLQMDQSPVYRDPSVPSPAARLGFSGSPALFIPSRLTARIANRTASLISASLTSAVVAVAAMPR